MLLHISWILTSIYLLDIIYPTDMQKILLSMPDELLVKLDEHCKKYSYERSEFVRAVLRTKLFGSTPGQPKIGEQTPEAEYEQRKAKGKLLNEDMVNLSDYKEIITAPKEPFVAPCTYEHCFIKRPQPLKEVTYLDDDQSRTFGPICQTCLNKAKTAGMFIGEGDQR